MSKLQPYNPFLDDEIDDFEFLAHSRQGQSGYLSENNTEEKNQWEAKKMQLLEERRRIEERTLKSSNLSLGLMYESEQVGILTAEEQREQLVNIKENLDGINSTMRTSQKNISSMKSMFGGIKNFCIKGCTTDQPVKAPAMPTAISLQDTVGNWKTDTKFSETTHPALRIRDLPYDEADATFDSDVSKDGARLLPTSNSFSPDVEQLLDKNMDDEVNDLEFLAHPHQGQSGYLLASNSEERNQWEVKRMQLFEERRHIQERTLQSTNSSLGLIYESEQAGISTAKELLKQSEQLENIEENLDVITSTMHTSQKHINSMKSMFGGFKNLFSKGTEKNKKGVTDQTVKAPTYAPPVKHTACSLQDTVENWKTDTKFSEATHPALRIHDLPYDEADATFDCDVSKDRPLPTSNSISPDVEQQLDKNLEIMSLGLGRLKNLAIGLNDEIEQQNEKLDVIHNKADKADETLAYQNLQIQHILKK